MRTGSRRLRCLPFTKKTKQCGLAKSKARLPPNFTQKLLTEKTFAPSSLAISTASSTVATCTKDCAGLSAETGLALVGDFHPVSSEAAAPGVGCEVGSLVGRVLPFSPLKEPTLKPLIQYKRKVRKPKSAVGQGELEDVGFLRRGFLKSSSSSSSLLLADRGFSGGGCSSRTSPFNSTGGSQAISPMEWSLFWSLIGSGDKGEEDKWLSYLTLMRNIGGGIRLRGVSFRSLGLSCFVGCFCRVGGEAVASCILCVY
jgi:hypothetical protein